MHTGEQWFTFGWPEYSFLAGVAIIYLTLALRDKLPSMAAFKDFADVVNSAGGNIILLSAFTMWSIKIAMQFFYHTIALPGDVISKVDAIMGQGVQFVTGTLVGTFAGALIKTLSGGKANGVTPPPAPVPDKLVASFVTAPAPVQPSQE